MEKKVKLHISAQTGRSFRTTVQGQRISSVGHVAQLIPAISSLLMTNSTWRLMSRMPSIFSFSFCSDFEAVFLTSIVEM